MPRPRRRSLHPRILIVTATLGALVAAMPTLRDTEPPRPQPTERWHATLAQRCAGAGCRATLETYAAVVDTLLSGPLTGGARNAALLQRWHHADTCLRAATDSLPTGSVTALVPGLAGAIGAVAERASPTSLTPPNAAHCAHLAGGAPLRGPLDTLQAARRGAAEDPRNN